MAVFLPRDPQYCERCLFIVSTSEGQTALNSAEGIEFYRCNELVESSVRGCKLCTWIWDCCAKKYWSINQIAPTDKFRLRWNKTSPSNRRRQTHPSGAIESINADRVVRTQRGSITHLEVTVEHQYKTMPLRVFVSDYKQDAHLWPFFRMKVSSASISSDWTFQALRTWLQDCDVNHSTCKKLRTTPRLPTRILDVASEPRSFEVHLHNAQPEERADYVALSYCWGGPQQFTTTSRTLESMIRGISLNSLPRTILDAIMVTRKLGMRFLWIDSLCIVQDSEDDKIHELAAMGDVYKNATVTIAAGNAEKVEDGFLSDRPMELCPIPIALEPNSSGTIYLAREQRKRELDDPLFRRGWAFQEFILSRRVILYDKFQVTFTCPEAEFRGLHSNLITYKYYTKSEFSFIGQTQGQSDNDNAEKVKLDRIGKWKTLIEEFSTREFTYFEDRLPAIAGIAKDLCGLWNEEYVAGLWRGLLIEQLGWYRLRDSSTFERNPRKLRFDPFPGIKERVGSPSWSWKTAPFAVAFDSVSTPDAIVLDCHIKLASSETPFGDVLEGRLVLRAKIAPLSADSWRGQHSRGGLIWDYNWTAHNDSDAHILYLGNATGFREVALIVRRVQGNVFERIGYIAGTAYRWGIYNWSMGDTQTVVLM